MESLRCDAEFPDFGGAGDRLLPSVREEIGGMPQPDCSFRFTDNDLDAAVQSAKKMKKVKRALKITGKKKRRKRKQSSRRKLQEMDPTIFVAHTSRYLKESKRYLIAAAVERLGIDRVQDLVLEVKAIQENGGQMTLDGSEQRTPGGILWNILRSRYKEDHRAIMAAGRSHKKQRRQQKKERRKRRQEGIAMITAGQPTAKQEGIVIATDGQPMTKRRRKYKTKSGMAPSASQARRTGVTVWPSEDTQIDDVHSKVDPENSCTLSQVQSARANGVWQGVEQGMDISCSDDVEMFDVTIKHTGPSPVT